MPHDVEAILREIPGLTGPMTVLPLTGGITNHNYRVEAGGNVFVLRVAGENTAQLGIDRHREHACAAAAASIGVGAEVVAHLPQHGAMLCRFVAGRVLSVEDAGRSDVRKRAARALARLHAGPSVPGVFCVFRVIEDYYRLATQQGVPMPPELRGVIAELDSLRQDSQTTLQPCPCHNDLLPGNLIDDGAAVRIIDWEYAGMGDRFFDLGNFAENHRLAADGEQEFLHWYFGQTRGEDLLRLRAMRRVSSLREAMWGFAQAGVSQLDFDFLGYARTHFCRFLARADE
jgi:thiamine kinase-like enzyme